MPTHNQRTDERGIITVECEGYEPMSFETPADYSSWERAYLTCIILNAGSHFCFNRNPPQFPVRRTTKRSTHE